MDVSSWSLGLSLIVATIAIHTSAVVVMALELERGVNEKRSGMATPFRRRTIPIVIVRMATVAVVLAVLHGIEGVMWAAAYQWLGMFDSFAEASAYSLAAMTTSETSAVPLASRWQMLSALEAVNGGLLFGISTAFLFAVIQVQWKVLIRSRETSSGS